MRFSFPLEKLLQEKFSRTFSVHGVMRLQAIGGGSINDTYRLLFGDKNFFCKVNSATNFPHLFLKERNGLELLAAQRLIKTPTVVDCFEEENHQFLLLEWIEQGERTEHFWKIFGEQLAALHRVSSPTFGLAHDNYMGSVPQPNTPAETWCSFFQHQRLSPMLKLCAAQGSLNKNHLHQFDSLQQKLPLIFSDEKPSLLHGDLWSGNFLCNEAFEPVLIDPAVYFGHRAMDLAMTTLFGGFRQPFYEAYHHHFPLPENYEEQWAVCNLFPLLIHLYLFGSGYLRQIESTLKQFA